MTIHYLARSYEPGERLIANDGGPSQDLFVRFAIVPRVNAHPDSEEQQLRGYVVIKHHDREAYSIAIETSSRGGIKAELRTLLTRYVGQNVEICLFECASEESRQGVAAALEVIKAPVRPLKCRWMRRPRFRPFDKPFLGRRFSGFVPSWYEPEAREPSLRALNFDDYRC